MDFLTPKNDSGFQEPDNHHLSEHSPKAKEKLLSPYFLQHPIVLPLFHHICTTTKNPSVQNKSMINAA